MRVGNTDGPTEGISVGSREGPRLGATDGDVEGPSVGPPVGVTVAENSGIRLVGTIEGTCVGGKLGSCRP